MRPWWLAVALAGCTPKIDHQPICQYLVAAQKQLDREASQKEELVAVMSGLEPADGPSVRALTRLETAQSGATAAWHTGFLKEGLVIPPSCSQVHERITELHRIRNDGLKEILLYWSDKDVEHLEKGTEIYQKADPLVPALNSEIEKLETDHVCSTVAP